MAVAVLHALERQRIGIVAILFVIQSRFSSTNLSLSLAQAVQGRWFQTKVVLNVSKHFLPNVSSGAPDRRVEFAETLLDPKTNDGVGRFSFKIGGFLKFFYGLRVNTDQDLVHDIDNLAKEQENHHLSKGFHFGSGKLGVSRIASFFWMTRQSWFFESFNYMFEIEIRVFFF